MVARLLTLYPNRRINLYWVLPFYKLSTQRKKHTLIKILALTTHKIRNQIETQASSASSKRTPLKSSKMSTDNPRVLRDLRPPRITSETKERWYAEHPASGNCGCINENAGRWRAYWKTVNLQDGKETSRAVFGRTRNWGLAKKLHEWGIDVYDDKSVLDRRRDRNVYGAWDGDTTVYRK